MDDLDRLAFRMVRTVRNNYPHLMAQGFTLTDLEERLVPFRDARREMSNNGPEAWEVTLLRMVSGERGYLETEADLKLACRQALMLTSPTLALVRPWSTTTLVMGPAAKQVGNERVQSVDTDQFEATALGLEFLQAGMPLATPGTRNTALAPASVTVASPTRPVLRTSDGHTNGQTNGQTNGHANGRPSSTNTSRANGLSGTSCSCKFCGGSLPEGRNFTFCPHCGVNQTVRQCPACSTELDVQWRFCVTCGRSAELPEIPETLPRTPDMIFT